MNKMVRAGQTKDLIEQVTNVGLDFKLMTQWTSFVAVEERVVNVDGKPQTIVQPVELPEGVAYEGIFGEAEEDNLAVMAFAPNKSVKHKRAIRKSDRGIMPTPMLMQPMEAAPTMDAAPASESIAGTVSKESSQLAKDVGDTLILSDDEDTDKYDTGITFVAGKSELSTRVKNILNAIARQVCQDMANVKLIVITGHADNSSADDFKQKLSLERAIAVADYLVSRCSAITKDKLLISGKADSQPIADNNTKIGQAKNRRVMIDIKR